MGWLLAVLRKESRPKKKRNVILGLGRGRPGRPHDEPMHHKRESGFCGAHKFVCLTYGNREGEMSIRYPNRSVVWSNNYDNDMFF